MTGENNQFSILYLGRHRTNVRFAFNMAIITTWGFLLRPLKSALSGKLIKKENFKPLTA